MNGISQGAMDGGAIMLFPILRYTNMKFAQDSQDEGYVITAYGENSVSINGKSFNQSLIITQEKFDVNWGVATVELLQAAHIEQLLAFKPELIIIGTGNKLIFPAVEVYSDIIKHGIGVDFMDTRAACRTYNILMSEGRHVVAGLIL
jgi:uncharacterized protein